MAEAAAMAELKTLKLKRSQLKGMLTRIESFVTDPIKLTSASGEMLQARKDKLNSSLNEYEQVQLDILSRDPKDTENVESFEEKYFSILSKLNECLKNLRLPEESHCSNSSSKLPNIEIPYFDGKDYTKYKPFMDLFLAIINNNKSLSDVQRLFYLRKYLKDEALSVVVNLPLENESYKEALHLLKKRFDNKARLVINHVNHILDLPSMQKGTAASIRSFISQVQQQLHALTNLKQPTQSWDMLLIPILVRKLDLFTKRAYQLDRDHQTLPTMDSFVQFLESRAIAFEATDGNETTQKKPIVSNVVSNVSGVCKFCKGGHAIHTCPQFKLAAIEDRLKFVAMHKLCGTCMRLHPGKCKFNFKCHLCKEDHNTLLHMDKPQGPQEISKAVLYSNNNLNNVILPTIKVKIINKFGQEFYVRALLDSGSQASFITTSLQRGLCLGAMAQPTNIIGIANNSSNINKYVNIAISSPVTQVQVDVKCFVIDSITSRLPQQYFKSIELPKNIQLADSDYNIPSEISLLLGADIYFNVILDGKIQLDNGLVLQKTVFGYVVGGPINDKYYVNNSIVSNFATCQTQNLENIMEKFWLSEGVPEDFTKATNEAEKVEECFKQSVEIIDDTFYVDLPLATPLNELQLGDSFSVALQRFLSLERKFKTNPGYFEQYKNFIQEYISLGHAKIVNINIYDLVNGPAYFLAHHAVLNEFSKTTKLRVVFDGSMLSKSKVCLNDVLMNGPIVQNELFNILVLFRTYKYTLICDITKMFRGIYVNKDYTCLQNILWRDSPEQSINCLQLQTVTYGLKSSTYLATRCLLELADRYGDRFPLAARVLRSNTYVDDVICGADSTQDLQVLKTQLINLLKLGSFNLHKWCSNCPSVLTDVPKDSKYFEELDLSNDNVIKTLGLMYNILPDELTFSSPIDENTYDTLTKRQTLSLIGRIFDPLGLIAPIIVVAKLLMQQVWTLKIGWDTMLPQDLLEKFQNFIQSLKMMDVLSIPRYISSVHCNSVHLIGYADASLKAFGCCLYLRMFNDDGSVSVNLICAKSKVSPLKNSLTIPRLELNSALLLAELTYRVHDILKAKYNIKVHLCSDSQITLSWIISKNLKSVTYVKNRVNKIHKLTNGFDWCYVKTNENPADLLSRGIEPIKLKNNSFWWHGPSQLSNKDFSYTAYVPSKPVISKLPDIEEDEDLLVNSVTVNKPHFNIFEKYSDFNKLQRTIAYILRFKHNSLNKNNKIYGSLTAGEMKNSWLIIIKYIQNNFYKEIHLLKNNKSLKSGLANLHPFIDSDGILRVGGRLQNANISYDKMHPIILPKSNYLTTLIIQQEHMRLLHAGPKLLLSSLSQRFWIISGIREVKKVVLKCTTCFRMKAVASKQLMGCLPAERINAVRPFQIVGIDFCGPFCIKIARIRNPMVSKCYIALYVCFATKAIHCELVSDLTTSAFLASLKRFIARRGMPSQIYCDNASTFKGACNELKRLHDLFHSKECNDVVKYFCSSNLIQFKFIPSYSPEFGGLWEAGVKSVKYHLKRIVTNVTLTFEELYTVISEIEAVLNSRPLLPVNSDPSNNNYLTPGHFIIGTAMTGYPEPDYSNVPIHRLKFWNICSKLKQDFWKSWSRDYLTQLQSRPKWRQAYPNLKEGDLVVVKTDNTPPMTWPVARIIKTFPGPDGRVRVAEIKIGNKTSVRSFRKLCPLPLN